MTGLEALPLAGRLLLAVVFTIAGVTKLRDRPGTRRSLESFGVPPTLAPAAGVVLPILELVVAAALLSVPTAAYGAAAALGLLGIFVVAIAINLAKGRAPDCHCFGQLHSAPVGPRILVRNGLLAVVAFIVMTTNWNAPGQSLIAWMGPLTPFQTFVALALATAVPLIAAQLFVLTRVFRQNQSILSQLAAQPPAVAASGGRPTGKSIGMAAPGFALSNLQGETITLDRLRERRRPVVLVFSDPNCGPCVGLVPEIGAWQREHADALTFALITRGTVEANLPKIEGHGLEHVLLQADREIAELYGVWGTPSAVMVRADGTIGSVLAQAEAEIRQLIDTLTGAATGSAPSPTPTPNPVPAASPDRPAPVVETAPAAVLPPAGGNGELLLNGRERPPLLVTNVPRNAKPVKATCVEDEMLPDGSLVLYNGCRKQVLTLNATAALVWECCDGDHDTDAMIAEVRDVFPAAAGAERDVCDVLETLAEAGMIAHPSITAVSAAAAATS